MPAFCSAASVNPLYAEKSPPVSCRDPLPKNRRTVGFVSLGGIIFPFALVLLCSIAGKFGGCMRAARWNGAPRREASIIGVMMNARGLTELIVINAGYEPGILPKSAFFMLVLMAVGTTCMTTPVLRRLFRGTEVWESYKASEPGQAA